MGEGHEGPYIVECELAVGYEGPEIVPWSLVYQGWGLLPIMGLNGDKKPSWMFWPKCPVTKRRVVFKLTPCIRGGYSVTEFC